LPGPAEALPPMQVKITAIIINRLSNLRKKNNKLTLNFVILYQKARALANTTKT
jgi:hypothetical protein